MYLDIYIYVCVSTYGGCFAKSLSWSFDLTAMRSHSWRVGHNDAENTRRSERFAAAPADVEAMQK